MDEFLDIREVKRCWPAPGFRQYQEKTLEAIVSVLNKRRVCVLDAPVGSGKSYILMAVAQALYGKTFYVTPQNMLVEQLFKDNFLQGKLEIIKGRHHYVCGLPGDKDRDVRCDVAQCKKNKHFECPLKYPSCPYWGQKMRAAEHKVCVTNFSYLIAEGFIPEEASCPTLGNRDLLIVDEGHNIGEVATDFVSCTISKRTLPYKFYTSVVDKLMAVSKTAKDMNDIKNYLSDLYKDVVDGLSLLTEVELNEKQVKDYDKLFEVSKRIEAITDDTSEWVFQFEPDDDKDLNRGWVKLIMKPLKVDAYMEHLIWRRADKIIISSGTPPVYPGAMADIGLATRAKLERIDGKIKRVPSQSSLGIVHVPSTFPIANRPIINRVAGFMTKDKEATTLPNAIASVDKILTENMDYRGVIHSNSYRHAGLLKDNMSSDNARRLVFHTSEDRMQVLMDWLMGNYSNDGHDNSVLVAVGMEEGLDLKGDLARFQVLFKVMYPSLGDKRVARRLELGERDWYRNLTLIKVIQSYGRAVRGPDDWAKFYVVDASFYSLVKDMKKYLPPWFVEAL